MVQSVDSLSLAEELNRRAEQAAKTIPVLLEVNAVGEASKFGCRPDQLLADLGSINALLRLEIQGLMTVPPWTLDPEKVRPVFRQMRELKERCEQLNIWVRTQGRLPVRGFSDGEERALAKWVDKQETRPA